MKYDYESIVWLGRKDVLHLLKILGPCFDDASDTLKLQNKLIDALTEIRIKELEGKND